MLTTHHSPLTTHHSPGVAGDLLEQNLRALARCDAELVQRIRGAALPDSFKPAIGRDGTATFRIAAEPPTQVGGEVGAPGRPPTGVVGSDARRRVWFGGSSMPSITAPIAIEQVRDDGSNLILPSAGTGLEVKCLVERLARHVALFVYEGYVAHLRAALSLHDWSAWLAEGRIIPIVGDDVGTAVAERIGREPGLELPRRLITLATQRGVDVDAMRRALEAASVRILADQQRCAEQLSLALRATLTQRLTSADHAALSTPHSALRVVVLSVDARPDALQTAAAFENTLRQMGWPVAVSVPDRPARCHAIARLSAVHAHRPDMVLVLNGGLGALTQFIPEQLPVASWIWHPIADAVAADVWRTDRPQRGIFAATPELLRQVTSARPAAADAEIVLLEAGVDTSVYRPPDHQLESALARTGGPPHVLVVGDVIDLRPELHVNLPSHVNLWNHACRALAARVDQYHPAAAAEVLDDAQRRSGVVLTENELREMFLKLIRERIAPSTMTRIAVERLLAARLEVRVMDSRGTIARSAAVLTGRQRRASPDRATQPPGDSADPRRCARAFSGARVVVFPHFTRSTARQVLEVLAAGGVPFYRRPQSAATDVPSIATYHPQLAEVLEQVPDFGRMDEMLRTIRTFERDAAKSAALAPVREVVRARHSLAARLETIRLHLAAPPPRA